MKEKEKKKTPIIVVDVTSVELSKVETKILVPKPKVRREREVLW
jgi:hypothetical protein